MQIIKVGLGRQQAVILLGRQGENLAREIVFDCGAFAEALGDGTIAISVIPPGGSEKYAPACLERIDNCLHWRPDSADTAVSGYGRCELNWVVGEVVSKTAVFDTRVQPSLADTGEGEAPEPYKDFMERVITEIVPAEEERQAAEQQRQTDTAAAIAAAETATAAAQLVADHAEEYATRAETSAEQARQRAEDADDFAQSAIEAATEAGVHRQAAEAAQRAAEGARDTATTAAGNAAQSEENALQSASDAAASEAAAATSATAAATSAKEAHDLARTYRHRQSTAADTWTINHNLHKYPSVTVVDSGGSTVTGEVQYVDEDNVIVRFAGAFSGVAYLN